MNLNLQTPKKQLGFIQLVGLGLAAASAVAGDKARSAQNKARRAQQEANRVRNFQAKRQFLRDFRQQQAVALTNPLASGADISSSAAQATLASQTSQKNAAVRDFQRLDQLGQIASSNLNKAANAQFAASTLGTVSSFIGSPGGQEFLGKIGIT